MEYICQCQILQIHSRGRINEGIVEQRRNARHVNLENKSKDSENLSGFTLVSQPDEPTGSWFLPDLDTDAGMMMRAFVSEAPSSCQRACSRLNLPAPAY